MTWVQKLVDLDIAMSLANEKESFAPDKESFTIKNNDEKNIQDQEIDTSSLFSEDSEDEYIPSSPSTTSDGDTECSDKKNHQIHPEKKLRSSYSVNLEDESAKSKSTNLFSTHAGIQELITSDCVEFSSPLAEIQGCVTSGGVKIASFFQADIQGSNASDGIRVSSLQEDTQELSPLMECLDAGHEFKIQQCDGTEIEKAVSQKVKPKSNTRKWDKKYSCFYCKKLISKLPRHLRNAHSEEVLVKKWLSLPDDSEIKNKVLNEIRNKGNYSHNVKVLTAKEDDGVLITKRLQPKVLGSVDNKKYLPCENCLGFFSRKYLFKHHKKCNAKTDEKSKNNRNIQARSALLIPSSIVIDKVIAGNILSKMSNDEVFEVIINDSLIISYGKKLYEKHDREKHLHHFVSQKMREMGRFVKCAKEINPDVKCLKDLIDKKHYKTNIDAVYRLASFNLEDNTFRVPSLALKTGNALRKCANILKGIYLNKDNEVGQETVENFISYFNLNWTDDVSTHAFRTLHERKWNAPKLLPLAEDVKKLNSFMKGRISQLKTELIENPSINTWSELSKLTLAHIVSFNTRRIVETQRLTVETYNKKQSSAMDEDIRSSLTPLEIKLAESLQRIETRGNRGNGVAILLTREMRHSIDILTQFRNIAMINSDNPFIFPASNSSESLRGCDVMHYAASKAGLQKPGLITSTRLRKHIGTMSQLLNLSKHELDLLARFMGHDIRVHRNFYRLSSDSIEMAKVSKILVNMEQGKISQFAGKSLDEIEVDVDEVAEKDPPSDDEDSPTTTADLGRTDVDCVTTMSIQSEESAKTQSQKRKPSVKKTSTKIPWTNEEKNSVMSFFSNEINLKIVPKKDKCINCIKENPVLANRSWRTVKFCVYNKIQSTKAKSKLKE